MEYDLVIIGSGPGGYVSAIRAGQVGMKVAIVEKEEIGGMCLNWGCIPSKAMIESAKLYQRILKDAVKFGIEGIDKKLVTFNYTKASQRSNSIVKRLTKGVEFLLKKNNVEIVIGEGKIINKNSVSVNNRLLEAENIMISTGTRFVEVVEGLKNVVSIKEFFTMKDIPEDIVVFGYDAPSVEIAQMLAMLNKNVTLLVPHDRIMPMADSYLSDYMMKILTKRKVKVYSNVDFNNLKFNDKSIFIGEDVVDYEMIINLGQRESIVPESEIEFEMEDGFLKTDKNLKTNFDNIYAVGDVNGKSRFAHIASAEGLFVINSLKGVKSELEFEKYPLNMYTVPEMAQIGKTEQDLKVLEVDYKISEFSLAANGKALAEGTNEGVVRILSENKYGEVLGVQIVADHATDLISEASAFMQLESTVYDVAKTVHAHPTISEAFMEAGFEGVDMAIHK